MGPVKQTAQLQCMAKGGSLEIKQVPMPSLEPDQVLVRQRAIGLNALDEKQRQLGILVESWPHVLGLEGAGVIEAIGSDVHDREIGDEVMAWAAGRAHNEPWGGSFQERIVVPACFTAKKPANISFEQAASLPICYNTAVIAILQGLDVPLPFVPGTASQGNTPKSVLVLGGASSVGANAIQLLRIAYPALPILATSSPAHHQTLHNLGATHVFDYHSPSIVTEIKAKSPSGTGVDMIIDCVGAGLQQTDICDVFAPDQSRLYSSVVTSPVDVTVPAEVTKRSISGWSVFDVMGGKEIIPSLTKILEEGMYKVPLPVKTVGKGLEHIADSLGQVLQVSGEKLVVTM